MESLVNHKTQYLLGMTAHIIANFTYNMFLNKYINFIVFYLHIGSVVVVW